MSEFTVEQLIKEIREADDLNELKKMVRPSEADYQKASQRIEQIDRIGEKYCYDVDSMPYHVANRYRALISEQDEFESQYC